MHQRNFFSTVRACLFIPPIILGLTASIEAKSINKDQVNIRSGPSLDSKIIFTVPLGYPIKIEKEANNWSFFHDWQNNSGWVYTPLVSDIETAVIVVEKANIRSTASIKSKSVANAEMGEIYTILAKEGSWIKLGYYHGGLELGWIRDDLIFGD